MNFQEFSSRIANIDYEKLKSEARICRGDILTMTTLAASGHPGGSMSTIDALLTVYHIANINKFNINDLSRDRIIVSHGHISPAVYSSLARIGILPQEEYIAYFRKAGSMYEGHIERSIPGVEWTTGNLGQGKKGRLQKPDVLLQNITFQILLLLLTITVYKFLVIYHKLCQL